MTDKPKMASKCYFNTFLQKQFLHRFRVYPKPKITTCFHAKNGVKLILASLQPPIHSHGGWVTRKMSPVTLWIIARWLLLWNFLHLQILRFQILNALDIYKNSKAGRIVVAKSRSLDPLENIQTRLSGYKEQLDLLSQQQSILNLYLDYLVESETLSKESGVNHLSRAKKAILWVAHQCRPWTWSAMSWSI